MQESRFAISIAKCLAVSQPKFESVCKSVCKPELVAFIESKYIAYQRAQLITDRITDELTERIAICIAFDKPEHVAN